MAIRVTIDPGHATINGRPYNEGAIPGYFESDMTLKLGKMLDAELRAYGIETFMTRTTATQNPALKARAMVAVNNKCNLFISLHSNAPGGDRPDISGVVVFNSVQRPSSMPFARKIAEAVAGAMGNKVHSIYPEESKTRPGRDYYTVIDEAAAGGVPDVYIVEHGFHTNPGDCAKLMDDGVLRRIAQAEARVIAEHYGLLVKPAPEKPVEIAPESLYSAIVTSQTLLFRDAPNTAGKVLGTLTNGEVLTLLEEMKPWAKLRRKDGVVGYSALANLRIEKVETPEYTADKPYIVKPIPYAGKPHFKHFIYPRKHIVNFGVSVAKGVTPQTQWVGETSDSFMRRMKPHFLSNGGFFGRSCSPVFSRGVRMLVTPGEEKWSRGLSIDADRKTFRFTDLRIGETYDGIAARPALIWDGKAVPAKERYVDGNFEIVSVVRKALGMDADGNLHTLLVENPGASLDEVMEWGSILKLQYLIVIDGGGSAREQALINGEPKHLTKCTDPNRSIANFIHWDLDCPYVVVYTVRKGDKGDTVRHLQRLLIALGYDLGASGADGDFGSKTDAAVRAFQKANGLVADGIVGEKSWGALGV